MITTQQLAWALKEAGYGTDQLSEVRNRHHRRAHGKTRWQRDVYPQSRDDSPEQFSGEDCASQEDRERPVQRKSKTAKSRTQGRVRRVDDPHHPRGYREICNDDELRDRKASKIAIQFGLCAVCLEPLPSDPREVEMDHIRRRGMGAAWRDDHMNNLQAVHPLCNSAKGSKAMCAGPVDFEARAAGLEMAFEELQGTTCIGCDGPKRPGTSFCPECILRLPDQSKLDLYRCTGLAWVEAHRNAKQFLLGRKHGRNG